ncbi:MAG: hypothetical protein ABL904_18375 [Hyphomicrobiaceae bacterium]
MSGSTQQSPSSVTFTLIEGEQIAVGKTLMRLKKPSVSNLSYLYVPLTLGMLLIAVAALSGVKDAAGFFPLLATGTIAYLSGYFALHYEIHRAWQSELQEAFRSEVSYKDPYQIETDESGLRISTPSINFNCLWTAISRADVVDEIVVYWLHGQPEFLAPVRAFESRTKATSFAEEIRKQIADADRTRRAQ